MMRPEYLDVQRITSDSSILKLFDAVENYGGALRFVGGAVRDCLASQKGFEIDLATDLTPDEVIEACNEKGLKTISLGLKFAKTGVVINNRVYVVSSLHKNTTASQKDSDLSFTDDWNADASTRDLTINAVYADEHGNVFDYYNGINDLEKGVVRFIGSADEKIKEQPIRILRFFRFFSIFSKNDIDLKGLKACVENKDLLKTIAVEQIRDEFFKILTTKNVATVLLMMKENDILSFLFPKKSKPENLEKLNRIIEQNNIEPDIIRRLFVLFEPDQELAESLSLRLKLTKTQKAKLVNLSRYIFNESKFDDLTYIKKVVFAHSKDFVKDKILIALVNHKEIMDIKDLFKKIDEMDVPVFPINGKDLIELGLKQGAPFKEIIGTLKNIWMESGFVLTSDDLKKQAKIIIK
ncbi:MAG: CCA tRNA nucleotidyltransferase [Alphaproteobacteria bacterium]|nr:CCA tRNA nucleotidyltransferase [Alphaproteobacteria bacterium]